VCSDSSARKREANGEWRVSPPLDGKSGTTNKNGGGEEEFKPALQADDDDDDQVGEGGEVVAAAAAVDRGHQLIRELCHWNDGLDEEDGEGGFSVGQFQGRFSCSCGSTTTSGCGKVTGTYLWSCGSKL
jgi:hypothetical protein